MRKLFQTKNIQLKKIFPKGKEIHIKEIDFRRKTGCSIICYKFPEGEYKVNPEPSLLLKRNSKLILNWKTSANRKVKQLYHV